MLSSLLLGLALAQTTPLGDALASEPRLQARRPYRERILAVSDFLAKVQAETGVSLRVVPQARDLKIALRVEDRSIAWTLEQIAETLDLSWRRASPGFELYQTPDSAAAQAAFRNAMETRRSNVLSDRFQGAKPYLGRPHAWIKARAEEAESRLREMTSDRAAGWSDRLQRARAEMAVLQTLSAPEGFVLAQLTSKLGPNALPAEGEAKAWASRPGLGFPVFEVPEVPEGGTEPTDTYFVITRLGDELHCRLVQSGRGTVGDGFVVAPADPRPLPPDRYLKWYQGAPEILERLNRNAAKGSAAKVETEDRITADAWLESSERTGVDLVAEVFRENDPSVVSHNFGSAGSHWAGYCQGAFGPHLKVVDGALLIRSAMFWAKRLREVPERNFAPLLAANRTDRLSFYDVAARFAMALRPSQIENLHADRRYEVHPNVSWARTGLAALRFWGQLSAAQKNAALERKPIPFDEMSLPAQAAFRRAILEHAHDAPDLSAAGAELLLSSLAGRLSGAAFLCEMARTPVNETMLNGRRSVHAVSDEGQSVEAAGERRDDYFYFGFDAATPVRFTCSLYERKSGG